MGNMKTENLLLIGVGGYLLYKMVQNDINNFFNPSGTGGGGGSLINLDLSNLFGGFDFPSFDFSNLLGGQTSFDAYLAAEKAAGTKIVYSGIPQNVGYYRTNNMDIPKPIMDRQWDASVKEARNINFKPTEIIELQKKTTAYSVQGGVVSLYADLDDAMAYAGKPVHGLYTTGGTGIKGNSSPQFTAEPRGSVTAIKKATIGNSGEALMSAARSKFAQDEQRAIELGLFHPGQPIGSYTHYDFQNPNSIYYSGGGIQQTDSNGVIIRDTSGIINQSDKARIEAAILNGTY
jgi:hypothetical protein